MMPLRSRARRASKAFSDSAQRPAAASHFRSTTTREHASEKSPLHEPGRREEKDNHGRDDAGYDSEEEERDLHHQDMYMNGGRNHHFGPPPTQEG